MDRTPIAVDLGGNGGDRLPLAMQGPDGVIEGLTAGSPLGSLLRRPRGRGGRRHRHRHRPIGQRDRLLAPRRVDGGKGLVVGGEGLFERFGEVLYEMEAVRDLGCLGGAFASAFRVGAGAIPRDDLYPRMLPQPLRHGRRGAVRQQGDRLAAFQVHEDRPVDVAFAQRPIIHTQYARGRGLRLRLAAQQPQERIAAHGEVPRLAEAHTGFAAQRDAQRDQALGQPEGPACPGGHDSRQALSEDLTWAVTIAAKPLTHPQLQLHAILRPRQVGQGPCVGTMDAPGWGGAPRAGRAGLRRLHPQGELRDGLIGLVRLQVQQDRLG